MALGSHIHTVAAVVSTAIEMWVGGWRNVAMGGRLNLPGESQRRLQNDGGVSLSETRSFHLLNMGIGQEWLLALASCHSHSLFLHRFVTKDSSFPIPILELELEFTWMFPGHSGPEHTLHGCLQRPLPVAWQAAPTGRFPMLGFGKERSAQL